MQAKEDFPFCLDISPNTNTAPALKCTGAGDTGNTDNIILILCKRECKDKVKTI